MTDQLRKAAEMAFEALENTARSAVEQYVIEQHAVDALRQALAQPEQRENRMTDREAIQKALDTPHRRYSIEPHGNGYAIYRDRDLFHHGFYLGHLTEVTPETIELIENALNTTLAQPEQEPVAFEDWLKNQHGDPEEIGFLQALRVAYYAGADSRTAPSSKPWVSLTNEEIWEWFESNTAITRDGALRIARAIESKLKDKNT